MPISLKGFDFIFPRWYSLAMPYSAYQIARFFIEKANHEGKDISPMKLIKLVYIAHAWSLTFYEKPLISEPVQAWKYGPVIESLYHGFKAYGNASIPIKEAETLPNADFDAPSRALLEKIWEKYGDLTAVHLSTLTHLPNTPWDIAWNQNGGKSSRWAQIPNELIHAFYSKKLEDPVTSGSGH
jgi:uncharacterized phage-associated protein